MMETTSIVTSSAVVASKPMNRGSIPWPGGPSKKQLWSLPDSIIHYMAKNPSAPKCYQKIVKSCKYFFEQNPFLVVNRLESNEDRVSCRLCSNASDDCEMFNYRCCVKVDIGKLSSKLWITDEINTIESDKNFIEMLRPKIYRCEAPFLQLIDQVVTFDSFKFLASSVQTLELFWSSIKYKNGKSVMLEEILKSCPNVEYLYMGFKDNSMVNASTVANIMKLDSLRNLKLIQMNECPEELAVADLSAFYKKYPNMKISLNFTSNISEEYKNQLDILIDEIIASEAVDHIIIEYAGQDEEKLDILKLRYYHLDI